MTAPSRTPAEIAAAVNESIMEISDDIGTGVLPAEIATFADLRRHVDPNKYAGFTDPTRRASWDAQDTSRVQHSVDRYLRTGDPDPEP